MQEEVALSQEARRKSVTTTGSVHCRKTYHSLSVLRTIQVPIPYFKSLEIVIHNVPFLPVNWLRLRIPAR